MSGRCQVAASGSWRRSPALLVELASGEDAEASTRSCCAAGPPGDCPPYARSSPAPARCCSTGSRTPAASPRRLAARGGAAAEPGRAGRPSRSPSATTGPTWPTWPRTGASPSRRWPRIHARTEFRVAFCGFAPGFGYLTGLPERTDVPRRATPAHPGAGRGASALAGPYTGVYPRSSPGGWQLIGTDARTPCCGTPRAYRPRCSAPGTRVRFVPAGARTRMSDRRSTSSGPER